MATGEELETDTAETAMTEVDPQKMSHWQKVVALVHMAFQEGRLAGGATWMAIEAVNRQLRITFDTFLTTPTIPMLQWSPPPLDTRTTAYHMASPARRPSWNAICTSATTFCQ